MMNWIIGEPTPALFGGYKRVMHADGINGFSGVIVWLPDPRVTAIVLANNDSRRTPLRLAAI